MIDRGADIGWLSQYPHEARSLFAPLTGLEVLDARARLGARRRRQPERQPVVAHD